MNTDRNVTRQSRPRAATRRGVAMVIVMVVVAVVAVLGFAMVSASTLQTQSSGNLNYAATAEYLAESGGQLALYYLQNPSKCSVSMPNGYYPGQTGVTFGTSISGSADITVTYDSTAKTYTITSVGKATTSSGGTISKTLTAVAAVVKNFKQSAAISASSNLNIPKGTVIGGVETNGQLSSLLGSTVTTFARYRSLGLINGLLSSLTQIVLGATDTVTVPDWNSVKDYTQSYTYNGATYAPTYVSATSLANTTLPTAAQSATNPLGILWTDHTLTLGANVVINGSLINTNGKVVLSGSGSKITAATGYPALVSQNDIVVNIGSGLTVNGLVYTKQGLATGGTLSTVTINGALIAAGSTPIATLYTGTLNVTYDATKVAVPDFSTMNTVTVGVRVVSWTMS